MRSSYSSTAPSRTDSDWPQQDEDLLPLHLGHCARILSPLTGNTCDPDDVDTCSELPFASRQHPGSGALMTAARHDAQITTSIAYNSDGSQPSCYLPALRPQQPHRSPVSDYYYEDDDEDMSDIEAGVFLDQATPTTQIHGHIDQHLAGAVPHDDFDDTSDDGDEDDDDEDHDEDRDLDLAQDPNSNESLTVQPFDPYPNFNGHPNFPLYFPPLYNPVSAMSSGLPPQAWAGATHDVVAMLVPDVEVAAAFDGETDMLPALQPSNPNPTVPGAENLGLVDFLRSWAYQGSFTDSPRSRPPHLGQVVKQANATIKEVSYPDLDGDECDLQGLNWTAMETTRRNARVRRCRTYKNYVNHEGSDLFASHMDDERIPQCEDFFRFNRMNIRQDVHLAHFQLRSILACPSRTHAYYPSPVGVTRLNMVSRAPDLVMSTRDFPTMGAALSTLDAACGVLMGGTFGGDYYLKSLDCEDKSKFTEGQITSDFSGITNHIKIYQPRRSCGPAAAIASNDCGFRVMDIGTEHFISETMYPFALNCSALSPDHRLRVLVGDSSEVLITNAETGEVLQELKGHRDYGFSCDWSEDGRTVATGFQDRGVKIWDARRWCNSSGISTPLCTIRSEMASVRGLRFSPLGSGKPVLVAVEEADYVNVIDAQTFASKQTIDVFGELGGVAFANDGQDLNILCCDKHRGGMLQLQRCGRRPELLLETLGQHYAPRYRYLVEDGDEDYQDTWARSRASAFYHQTLEPF